MSLRNRLRQNIVTGVLSEMLPHEEVGESDPGDRVESVKAPIEVP